MAQSSGVPEYAELIDLASSRFGGEAVAASDDFFAPRQNLLNPDPAVFIPGKFTDRGKWMDGWESRRKREPGHDWCIVRLGLPGHIRGFNVDTTHFTGNYPESCAIEAAELDPKVDPTGIPEDRWVTVLERRPLSPSREHYHLASPAAGDRRFTHVRLNIYPDGGVARLRVFGEVVPDWEDLCRQAAADRERSAGIGSGLVDLAAVASGGMVVAASDMHFGSRHNLIMPGRAANMGDGWETRRKRGLTWGPDGPNEWDWCIVRLGRRGIIHQVEIDTHHFKGNFPHSADVLICDAGAHRVPGPETTWRPLLDRTRLRADERLVFHEELSAPAAACTHAQLRIYPDGGVSRLRLWGIPL